MSEPTTKRKAAVISSSFVLVIIAVILGIITMSGMVMFSGTKASSTFKTIPVTPPKSEN